MPVLDVIGVLALVGFFLLITRRANQLFCLSVRDGHALLVHGRIPAGLRDELLEVLRRAGVREATIIAAREGGGGRLLASGVGLDERVLQRLRNVFGSRPWRDLQLCPPPTRRNWGQRLGWTWLAWRLHRPPRGNLREL